LLNMKLPSESILGLVTIKSSISYFDLLVLLKLVSLFP